MCEAIRGSRTSDRSGGGASELRPQGLAQPPSGA